MEYRMRAAYLKGYSLDDTEECEKQLVEDITKNVFHKWNDKLEVLTRICEWYDYVFRFYPDGRMVMQMLSGNTKDEDSEWRGKDDCGHLEYPSLDAALIDWQDELGKNEGSYKFDEEIEFIKKLSNKKVNYISKTQLKELWDKSPICIEFANGTDALAQENGYTLEKCIAMNDVRFFLDI